MRLDLRRLDPLTERAFTFRFQPQAIDVAADPGLAVPTVTIASLPRLIFGKIEHDLIIGLAALFPHHVAAGRRHFGSGKELLRIMVHRWPRRSGSPCGQVRPRLSQAGHRRHVMASLGGRHVHSGHR